MLQETVGRYYRLENRPAQYSHTHRWKDMCLESEMCTHISIGTWEHFVIFSVEIPWWKIQA